MSFARSIEPDADAMRGGTRKRPDVLAAEPAITAPRALTFAGPAALRPDALLQVQSVLGNAHVGRVFRSPAETPPADATKEKKNCACGGEEECTCGK